MPKKTSNEETELEKPGIPSWMQVAVLKLDGETTGSQSFSGPIGAKLMGCKNLFVLSFDPVPVAWTLEVQNADDTCTDKIYLLHIYATVSTELCPLEFEKDRLRPCVKKKSRYYPKKALVFNNSAPLT